MNEFPVYKQHKKSKKVWQWSRPGKCKCTARGKFLEKVKVARYIFWSEIKPCRLAAAAKEKYRPCRSEAILEKWEKQSLKFKHTSSSISREMSNHTRVTRHSKVWKLQNLKTKLRRREQSVSYRC